MKKKIIILAAVLFGVSFMAKGQSIVVKTNLIHGATATPNLAAEFAVGRKTTMDVYWGFNGFEFADNTKWKHYIVQPEFRWWFCERFSGSFIGVHAHAGEFNIGNVGPLRTFKEARYEGSFYGAGVSYGHHWIISNRWGFELEMGLGYARVDYDKFRCAECSPKIKSGIYNYFGPTKIQASIVFYLW